MKRLLQVLGVLLILVIVAAVVLYTNLDRVVKGAIETYGPRYTGTDVSVEAVNLSPRSGEGSIRGLRVANPEGFSAPEAFALEAIDLGLVTGSLRQDPVVVRRLHIRAPVITYQMGEDGNNLQVLRDHIRAATGGGEAPGDSGQTDGQRFVIEEFVLSDGQLRYATPLPGGESVELAMPDIRLTDIGRKANGVTGAEALAQILAEVNRRAREAIADAGGLRNLEEQLEQRLEDEGGELKDRLEGVRGLLEE